jgi:autotransporter-associated beta strand protein
MNISKSIHQVVASALVSIGLLTLASSGEAATFQWTNAASGTFVTAANWTNTIAPFANGVPTTGDTAINNVAGSTTTIDTGDSVAAGIVQAQTGTISITGGDLTATTAQATGSNGLFSVSGGTVNLLNMSISGAYGAISIGGGTNTVTTDSRVATANAVWNVSGGILNLSKHTIGSAAASNTNNVMTVSGNAAVTQTQGTGGGANRELWIGGNNGGSGTVILKDNATWTNSAANGSTDVIIGRASAGGQTSVGILTIQDNASMVVQSGAAAAKVIQMAITSTAATGTLNLNGGSLSTIGITRGSGTAIVNVNGGKLVALTNQGSFFNNFPGTSGSNSVNLQAGGLTFDTSEFNVGITNVLSGAGGLTKIGNGTLTLSGSNTFSGAVSISGGTLKLNGAGTINNGLSVTVSNFSTLDVTNASRQLATSGMLTLNDGTLVTSLANTNVVAGTFGTGGSGNTINISALPTVTSLPASIRVVKYTTAAPGLVDGNNVLTTLSAVLPAVSSPEGYLSNIVASSSINLIITNMVLNPVITQQPAPDSAYAGFKAHFAVQLAVTNSPGLGYRWRKAGTPLNDGGNISGATTPTLRITNVSGGDVANYDVVITNTSGSVTSSVAALTVRTAAAGYETAALTPTPSALYMLDELTDPATTNAVAFDYAGDLDGIYGIAALNGFNSIPGPVPADGLPGFDVANTALQSIGVTSNSSVVLPALNLNTNTVTLAAWIKPASTPVANAGLVFCRGAGTVAGMNFTPNLNGAGDRTIGYTWNNEAGTFNWNSRIAPPFGIWSFVALVVTPTNATVYVFNANGLVASSQTYNHVVQNFAGPTLIGDDAAVGFNRQFDGTIDGVAIYGQSLSQAQLEALYAAGSGVSTFPPTIWAEPASLSRYEHQTAVFNVQASGSLPLSYQWKMFDGVSEYSDVVNGGRFSGATSPTLTISNLALADATNLVVVVTNLYDARTSSVVTLTVNPTVGPATDITTSVIQPSTDDWDTASAWSIAGSATDLAGQYYGSTFTVLAPGGLRTPSFGNPGTPTSAFFPGEELRVEGNGTFDTSLTNAGAIRIKGGNPSTVYFKKLVMAGGQISSILNSGWSAVLTGEINVLSNAVIWAADDTSPRSITIQSTLTGNGSIQYHAYNSFSNLQTSSSASLNIASANNPYTGTWNVELGTLAASGANSLGTNAITVGAQGALQANYDINNPNGTLILNGRFNLTRNHTFKSVTVNGTPLSAGVHSFATLNAAFPTNFPASWTGVNGALTETTGSGSITIPGSTASYPTNITSSFGGGTLSLSWPATHLGWFLQQQTNSRAIGLSSNWTDITGSDVMTSTNIAVNPAAPTVFYRLRHP